MDNNPLENVEFVTTELDFFSFFGSLETLKNKIKTVK